MIPLSGPIQHCSLFKARFLLTFESENTDVASVFEKPTETQFKLFIPRAMCSEIRAPGLATPWSAARLLFYSKTQFFFLHTAKHCQTIAEFEKIF